MSLPALALFSRAVMTESRQNRTYLLRMALAGGAFVYVLNLQFLGASVGAPGLALFARIMSLNLIMVSLMAIGYFPSAISEERQEDALALLRMTRLSPAAILFGKSVSRLFGAGALVLIQMPFTLLAVALGGITHTQFAAAYATLLSYLIFLSALGLFCSLLCKHTWTAALLTALCLGAFLTGGPLLRLIAALPALTGYRVSGWMDAAGESLQGASPVSRMDDIMSSKFAGAALDGQVAVHVLIGAALFLLAGLLFDRFTRERAAALPWRVRGRLYGPGPMWRDPLSWKDFNFVAGGWPVIILKTLFFAGLLLFLMYRVDIGGGKYLVVMGLAAAMLVAEYAGYASRLFSNEMADHTLASLALTPRHARQIAWSKTRGCLYAGLPALFAVLAAGAAHFACGFVSDTAIVPLMLLGLIEAAIQGALLCHLTAWSSLRYARAGAMVGFGWWCLLLFLQTPLFLSAYSLWLAPIGIFLQVLLVVSISLRLQHGIIEMIGVRAREE